MRPYCRIILLAIGLLSAWLPIAVTPAAALDAITLQLKWTHAFQFAGYYAAKEQGYYREAGLDVRILEAEPATDPVRSVLSGQAQYGVGTSNLILERHAGKPVTVLAVIFQQSPYEIYAAPGIHNLRDLIGKRLMLEPQAEELLAYLKKEGIPLDQIEQVPHSFDAKGLIQGKAEAISGYISNEPYFFKEAQYAYQTFSPRSAGIDFYGDNLFTSEAELREHPDRVKAFRAASLRGWQYAKEHHDEIIELIYSQYSQKNSRDFLRFESDQMIPLLQPNLIEIGYMNPRRWRHIADTYAGIGLLPADYLLDGFLYDATKPDLTWFYAGLGIALLVVCCTIGVAGYIHRSKQRLLQVLDKNREINEILAEREELWRTIIKTSPDGIILTSMDGKIQQVSDNIPAMYGYDTPDEIIGRDGFEFIDPSGHETARTRLGELVNGTYSGTQDYLMLRKDGSRFSVEHNTAILHNNNGSPRGVLIIERDIDQRKQAEQALLKSEEKFRKLFELSADPCLIIDGEIFVDCNQAAVDILHAHSKSEVLNSLPWELSPALQPDGQPSRQKAAAHIATARQSGAVRFEWVHQRKDGSNFHVEVSLTLLHDQDRIYTVWRDITARKQAESRQRELERKLQHKEKTESLGRMAGAIAHRYNNLMGVVLGNLELALPHVQEVGGVQRHLNEAIKATQQAAEVSGLMLAYLGQTPGKQEQLDLGAACRQHFPRYKNLLSNRVELQIDLPATGPVIKADSHQIRQVLSHLITNAVEASVEDQGTIQLSVSTLTPAEIPVAHRFPLEWQPLDLPYVCVSVKDNGCGIADENIQKLFDPFYTTRFTGRGLGLSVTLGIIRAHNGSIAVESTPGQGSCFRFFLPLYTEPRVEQAAPAPSADELDVHGAILLVDDEEMVRDVAKTMLLSLGFEVIEARNGREAVALFNQHSQTIRCVLCDLSMPEMDGWETLTALRQLSPEVVVILASGYDQAQVMEGEHPERPQLFLAKPYRVTGLQEAIAQALTK